MNKRFIAAHHVVALLILPVCLTACQVEGGIAETPTARQVTAQPQPTDGTQAAAVAARRDTWTVGMFDQPTNLSPYQASAAEQRRAAAITEVLFPAPVLALGGTYTTTGVLDQLPTIENGSAELRKADVYLDSAGVITTTATQVITQVDQIVVTYRWNPRLRWSDGTPLTAEDSVFAYEHARSNPASDDSRAKISQTVSYTALDAHTTQVVLKPDVVGPAYLLDYWVPLPRHVLAQATPEQWAAFEQQPIGYGPYMIEQREPGAIRMVRNPYYFGAPPANSRLDLLFAQSLDLLRSKIANGNIDLVISDRMMLDDMTTLDNDAQAGTAQVSYAPSPIWEHIDFNLDVPALQDFHVRRAIAYGTNRQLMVQQFLGNHSLVLDSWVLPFQPEAASADQLSRYGYDPDQARKQLDEAGYKPTSENGIRASPDGLTLTLQLLTTADSPLRQAIAEQFRNDMRAIGIDVEVTTADAASLFAAEGPLYQRQFELALYGWKAEPNAGGLSLWSCNAVPAPENNFTGENFAAWCFRDADMAIRRGATTLDNEQRKALYLKQQQIWTQELPGLPLFPRLNVVLMAPGISGPQAETFAPATWNVAQWRRGA